MLIADDEPLITAGIRTVLESAGDIDVIAQAENDRSAVEQVIGHRPDGALIDISMPVMDGLSAVEDLRRRMPGLRTVMLTAFGAEPHVLRALHHRATVPAQELRSRRADPRGRSGARRRRLSLRRWRAWYWA